MQSCYKSEINPCQLVLITLKIEKIDIWYCMWPPRERFHITFRYGMDRDFVLPQDEKTVNREESIIYSLEGKPVRNVEC